MSDELRLPDDLAAYEALLAAQSLPPVDVDRRQLLYRAGWAACEAQLRGGVTCEHPQPSRVRLVAWSSVSAALAATLAVAATLQLQSPQWQQAGDGTASMVAAPVAPRATNAIAITNSDEAAAAAAYVDAVDSYGNRPGGGPLLAMRWRARAAATPVVSDADSDINGHWTKPKTAGELRLELLPGGKSPPGMAPSNWSWPWNSPLGGESI